MEDTEIIEMYFARNEAAINQTAGKYRGLIRSIAYNILRNTADSEECENDTYLAAWDKIPPERPRNFGAFLGRIARNIALNKYAYYTADKRNREFETALSELHEIAGGSTETEFEAMETGSKISDFLRGQNRVKRGVFVRRYWYAESINEIALKYGFSVSKVKSMLMRTRRELKIYLDREGIVL